MTENTAAMTLPARKRSPALAVALEVWQRMQQLLQGNELVIDGKSLDIGAVAMVA